jgi:HK97 family phage portal protein
MGNLTILGALKNAATGKSLHAVSGWRDGWRRIIEPYAGAWQQNQEETKGTILTYPTLYACLNRISQDIGKLPFVLKALQPDGTERAVENPAYSPVLKKPNHYQTAQQFREAWALSRMIHGNAYILKGRDERNVVTRLYVLDPCRVMPMISDSGDVFYKINYTTADNLLPENYPGKELIVPAREIIHDRLNCFHHQLIGVPPVCAAHWPTVKNLKILKSSAQFFGNNAQPGGILTAPAGMNEPDAEAVKAYWNTEYGGSNTGKIAVIGADMKFTAFAMKSADSQLVEQMRYSDEQICQPFGIPPFKIGIGSIPAGLGVDAINLLYYGDALSGPIESIENLLDEGLSIPSKLGIWMDIDPLLRMDVGKQAEVETKFVSGKIKTPDEARRRFNLAPTGGGDTLWGQHQDYPLGVLAERNDLNPVEPAPPEPSDPDNDMKEEVRRLTADLWQRQALEATREAINA